MGHPNGIWFLNLIICCGVKESTIGMVVVIAVKDSFTIVDSKVFLVRWLCVVDNWIHNVDNLVKIT